MSNLDPSVFTSKILLGATFARAIYPSNGAPFTPPVGFDTEIKFSAHEFTPTSGTDFNAGAYYNKGRGDLGLAYTRHPRKATPTPPATSKAI